MGTTHISNSKDKTFPTFEVVLQFGLYSGWVGCLVYIVFGSTRQISIGPTALLSLLTFTYTHHLNPDMAVFLCFVSGCVELLCGMLQLGECKSEEIRGIGKYFSIAVPNCESRPRQ
jgi:hypothetical protein